MKQATSQASSQTSSKKKEQEFTATPPDTPQQAVVPSLQPAESRDLSHAKGLSRERITEMRDQLALLQEFVAKVMIRGEHYGVIPGTQKPTLFKAGAEFLREAYGFEVKSTCVERKFLPAEQADRQFGRKKDYVEFTYRLELFMNGKSVAVCEGSCNNYERRYDSLSAFAVMNTIQKMAQKRAYVGAVISATRSSNIFTQDLEDEPELATGPSAEAPAGLTRTVPPAPSATVTVAGAPRMATPNQAKLVWARLKADLKLSDEDAREFISVTVGKSHSRELTAADVEELLDAIDSASA